MSLEGSRLLVWVLLVLSVVTFGYQIRSVWVFTVDDSFITFRYAENLAHGFGLNFNRDSPRAEGYTSVLWVTIMTIPHLLGLDAVLFAKMGGVLLTIITCVVVFRFVMLITGSLPVSLRRVFGSLAVLMVVSSHTTSIHAVSGMETACATLLLLTFLYLATSMMQTPHWRKMGLLALVGLMLGLCRPEANVAVVLGISSSLSLLPRRQRKQLLLWALVIYVLPGLVYFSARWIYYGTLLPLPFYVKVSEPHALAGLTEVARFLEYVLPLGLCSLLGLWRVDRSLVPGVVSCLSLLLFFLFPAHVMGYDHRLLFPVFPFVTVMAARGIAVIHAGARSSRSHPPKGAMPDVVVGAACIGVLLGLAAPTPGAHADKRSYAEGLQKAHIRLGRRLGSLASPGNRVLAIEDAGAVPYYSKWTTVDIFGLNDPEIAVSGQHDPEYVLSYHPDVVVIISYAKEKLQTKSGREYRKELYERCIRKGMFKACTLESQRGSYYLWVMAIPGTPIAESLERMDE